MFPTFHAISYSFSSMNDRLTALAPLIATESFLDDARDHKKYNAMTKLTN